MGFVQRQRDPEDERQVRIKLSERGRQLRENRPELGLEGATGLDADEFAQVQQAVVQLRNNLVRAVKDRE
ncbi:hypothetical protein D3C80_2126310 [compost metagenome]